MYNTMYCTSSVVCTLFVIGDLGGILGLFLGGSAISIFEIVDLFVYNLALQLSGYVVMRHEDQDQLSKTKSTSRRPTSTTFAVNGSDAFNSKHGSASQSSSLGTHNGGFVSQTDDTELSDNSQLSIVDVN